MRQVLPNQRQLGEADIASIELDSKCRDDIPKLLRGLQFLYTDEQTRDEVFKILEGMVPTNVDADNGRPGMHLWRILVMGTLRLNLDWDYDRLHNMVNNHKTIRQMLGHGLKDEDEQYTVSAIMSNVSMLTPEILDRVNQAVVVAGHRILKKSKLKPKSSR
jgi:hypothetical protein